MKAYAFETEHGLIISSEPNFNGLTPIVIKDYDSSKSYIVVNGEAVINEYDVVNLPTIQKDNLFKEIVNQI